MSSTSLGEQVRHNRHTIINTPREKRCSEFFSWCTYVSSNYRLARDSNRWKEMLLKRLILALRFVYMGTSVKGFL